MKLIICSVCAWYSILLTAVLTPLPGRAEGTADGKPRFHGRNDAWVRYVGVWRPVVAGDKELGPYAMRSDGKGASAELDFIGTSVGLVHQSGGLGWEWGVICPDTGHALGLAEVRIDGHPAAAIPDAVAIDGAGRSVIDTSRGGRTLLAKGLTPGRHRVTVTNLGQPREPGGSVTVVVKGFWIDADGVGDAIARRAWLTADAVRGGEGWRARAAELAAATKGADDLARLNALHAASLEMDAVAAKLRAVTAEPPPSPMVERERQ